VSRTRGRTALLVLLAGTVAPSQARPGEIDARTARKPAAPAAKPHPPTRLQGIAVATLAYATGPIEREVEGVKGHTSIQEGEFVRTGDRITTGPASVARIAFPWMSVTGSPSTTIRIPSAVILSAVLEEGRAEIAAKGGDILKVHTAEAEVRGAGRVVVRRDPSRETLVVAAREGTFQVEAAGQAVTLRAGEGTVVRGGAAPAPAQRLPPPPTDVSPGTDPVYVVRGEPARLSWHRAGTTHHFEILPLESSDVLLESDVGPGPEQVTIPWLGTYRWRVAARDAQGLESLPSVAGYICVVEK
jgi:hypothetical protein